jgi:hypothetical protein
MRMMTETEITLIEITVADHLSQVIMTEAATAPARQQPATTAEALPMAAEAAPMVGAPVMGSPN